MAVKTTLKPSAIHQLSAIGDRTVNDGKYIGVFWAILLIWMVSCGYVIHCTRIDQSHPKTLFVFKNDLQKTATAKDLAKNLPSSVTIYNNSNFVLHDKKALTVFIWMSVISYSSLLMDMILLIHQGATWKPPGLFIISFTSIATMICYRVIMYYSNVAQQLDLMHTNTIYRIVPEGVLFVFCFLAELMRFTCSKKIAAMGSLWKKTFMYYRTFPILLLVGSGTCITIILFNSLTKQVLEFLIAQSVASNMVYWIIYSANVYIIVLINILGRMIISTTAANYWNGNSRRSPVRLIEVLCQKIDYIFSYQFGSACYKATYTSVWLTVLTGPLLGYDFANSKIAEICLIVLLLMLNIDHTVLIIAIFGLRASEARKQVVSYFVNVPKKLSFICQNLWSTTFLIFLPKSYFMLMLMRGLNEHDVKIKELYLEISLVALPMIIVLGTMEDTRSICIMRKKTEKQAAIWSVTEAKMYTEKSKSTDKKSAVECTQMFVITDSNIQLDLRQNYQSI